MGTFTAEISVSNLAFFNQLEGGIHVDGYFIGGKQKYPLMPTPNLPILEKGVEIPTEKNEITPKERISVNETSNEDLIERKEVETKLKEEENGTEECVEEVRIPLLEEIGDSPDYLPPPTLPDLLIPHLSVLPPECEIPKEEKTKDKFQQQSLHSNTSATPANKEQSILPSSVDQSRLEVNAYRKTLPPVPKPPVKTSEAPPKSPRYSVPPPLPMRRATKTPSVPPLPKKYAFEHSTTPRNVPLETKGELSSKIKEHFKPAPQERKVELKKEFNWGESSAWFSQRLKGYSLSNHLSLYQECVKIVSCPLFFSKEEESKFSRREMLEFVGHVFRAEQEFHFDTVKKVSMEIDANVLANELESRFASFDSNPHFCNQFKDSKQFLTWKEKQKEMLNQLLVSIGAKPIGVNTASTSFKLDLSLFFTRPSDENQILEGINERSSSLEKERNSTVEADDSLENYLILVEICALRDCEEAFSKLSEEDRKKRKVERSSTMQLAEPSIESVFLQNQFRRKFLLNESCALIVEFSLLTNSFDHSIEHVNRTEKVMEEICRLDPECFTKKELNQIKSSIYLLTQHIKNRISHFDEVLSKSDKYILEGILKILKLVCSFDRKILHNMKDEQILFNDSLTCFLKVIISFNAL